MKIVLQKNTQLWFTSDSHYSHVNICRSTTKWKDADDATRDFKSLDHMNDVIVDSINDRVQEHDILIHLGDWSFGGFENIKEFRQRLHCKNIHLILGNHDHHILRNRGNVQGLFSSVSHYMYLDVCYIDTKLQTTERQQFALMHYPIASWDNINRGVIHLHGHTHLSADRRISAGRAMDIGVDGNNMCPISYSEIMKIMHDRPVAKLCLPKKSS